MSEAVLPPVELGTKRGNNPQSFPLSENDKIIFEELKQLILQGEWESLGEKLLEYPSYPIDFQDGANEGYSLVHHATSGKQVECLQLLITDFWATPDIKTYSGYAPIHLLVSSDCRCTHCTEKILKCLKILMDGGANVDDEDNLGETPLYSAARNRLCKPAAFLLGCGANINHWVNGTSVATLLAQYVPDVLKTEFDKYITIAEKQGTYRSLRLDFRLLLQEEAIKEGLVSPSVSPSPKRRIFLQQLTQSERSGSKEGMERTGKERTDTVSFLKEVNGKLNKFPASSASSSISTDSDAGPLLPPKETELLNHLLKADFASVEAVVNHPLVESFVHLKWLSVRKLFFVQRSLYLFLISLYTFYVFDTFVNATCSYRSDFPPPKPAEEDQLSVSGRQENNIKVKATSNSDSGTQSSFLETGGFRVVDSFYYWNSFSDYFKAHELTCEPTLSTTIMAYVFAVYVVILVLYELYKFFESWHDYFQSWMFLAWWVSAINIGITVVPGLGIYSHSWFYPFAAFSLVYGWILVLAQVDRMPYLGDFVGVFVKVLKDFSLLLFTFSPVLVAFALGFSVMLPQHEFFRSIPGAFFKVFLMMTGDVDFWGVFRGTWTTAEVQGHVYIPLFIIYSVYILTVTMVLMSLLMGLAVDNIQEVRREAALYRTVSLIKEIGIFESILHQPILYRCGFSVLSIYLRRLFSIYSLKGMKGPELIIFPENPQDQTLPSEIKQKLVAYLTQNCCSLGTPCPSDQFSRRRIMKSTLDKKQIIRNGRRDLTTRKAESRTGTTGLPEFGKRETAAEKGAAGSSPHKEALRRTFLFQNETRSVPSSLSTANTTESTENSHRGENTQLSRDLLRRDLQLYKELNLLLEDNENLRKRLEALKHSIRQ